jgi:hypothetical protein
MEQNYYQKYLKYKKKYLNLQKLVGGDVFFYVKPTSTTTEAEIMSSNIQVTNQKIMIKPTDILRIDMLYCKDSPKSNLILITNLIKNDLNKTLEIEYISLLDDEELVNIYPKKYIETVYTDKEINELKSNKQPMRSSITEFDIKLIYKKINNEYIVQNIFPKKQFCNKETRIDSSDLSNFKFEYLRNH